MSRAVAHPDKSVIAELYRDFPFRDRYANDPRSAVDVVIPVMHTNELWRANLHSIYREIPVNRLLISDGGCVDDSIEIAKEYPRVVVLDHRDFTSLGYSLRKLIEAVQTDWFVYLHSDVYLAAGWFEAMLSERQRFDWFEATQHTAVLIEMPHDYGKGVPRARSGAQMGRRRAFDEVLPAIDDDYLYRNEDIILAHLVERAGHRYGRAAGAVIYHEQMERRSRWQRSIKDVKLEIRKSAEEDLREQRMQLYGLLKYMTPDPVTFQAHTMIDYVYNLRMSGDLEWPEFREWVMRVNPGWWPIIQGAYTRRRLSAGAARAIDAAKRVARRGIAGILRVLRI